MEEEIFSKEDFVPKLSFNDIATDLRNVLKTILSRKNIDMITRIKDSELDKICRMYYFGVRHTYFLNKALIEDYIKKNKKIDSFFKNKYSDNKSAIEVYTMTNLYLRLSLDSASRQEIENIASSVIQKKIEEKKAEIENANQPNR